jgi:hypothetical protein
MIAMVVLIEALIIVPGLAYTFWGRQFRRLTIMSYFTAESIAHYFEQFWLGKEEYAQLVAGYHDAAQAVEGKSADAAENEKKLQALANVERDLTSKLEDLYNTRFGIMAYLLPLLILAGVLFIEITFAVELVTYLLAKNASSVTARPIPVELMERIHLLPDKVALAGLAGAYLWVGIDILRRVASLTLLPSDLAYYSLRMVTAPILGFAVGTAAGNADTSVMAAFTICVLPIADIMTWVRSIGARLTNVKDEPEAAPDRLINLPGVDSLVAARLQDQGISTILQLCDADPVQLSMRTGLDFAFVVRLVDQSLAWRYFNTRLRDLNAFGWSGASDILASGRDFPTLEKAALGYAQAKDALERARTALGKSKPENANYQSLVQRQSAAQARYETAARSLRQADTPGSLGALIATMEQTPALRLTREGVSNSVRGIKSDRYVSFIAQLMYEIDTDGAIQDEPSWFEALVSRFFGGSKPGPADPKPGEQVKPPDPVEVDEKDKPADRVQPPGAIKPSGQ